MQKKQHAGGRLRRSFECAAFVGVWIALGKLFHLSPEPYLLLGVPLTLRFQRFVARAPIPALWVRGAERFRLDRRGILVAIGLALAPCWVLGRSLYVHHLMTAAWSIAAIAGAPAAAFAIRSFRREQRGYLFKCLAVAGAIGSLFPVVAIVYRVLHAGVVVGAPALVAAREFIVFVPVCFVLEEVAFRGALDAYISGSEERPTILSSLIVAALWGLWHVVVLPASSQTIGAIAIVVVASCLVGLPLSLYFRKSGNLLVPAVAHSFVDTLRDVALSALRA